MKKTLLIFCLALMLISCGTVIRKKESPMLLNAKQNFYQGNYQVAAKDLLILAKAGDADAEYALGYMYYYGLGVPRDLAMSRKLISTSADKGNREAIVALRLLVEANSVFANLQNDGSVVAPGPKRFNPEVKNDTSNEVQPFKIATKTVSQSTIPALKQPKEDVANPELNDKVVNIKEMDDLPILENVPQKPKEILNKASNDLNQWMIQESVDSYTIQLAANRNFDVIDNFIKKHNITDQAKTYTYNHNNEQWYAVSIGVYKESSTAYNMLTSLPDSLKANKPWVRPIESIKKDALALNTLVGAHG